MNTEPRMLRVETGYVTQHQPCFAVDDYIDYRVYDNYPRWLRSIENVLRLDVYLALKAKKLSVEYDIIWANSEKVAIPLGFLGVKKPIIAILQFLESPLRVFLLKITGMAKSWAGIGIVSPRSRKFLEDQLGIASARIFQYYSARLDIFTPDYKSDSRNGPIMSVGVAKRDYNTLIQALSHLKGFESEIFISSKYGDKYRGQEKLKQVDWIKFPDRVSQEELCRRYQQARFVVVPLLPTSHSGAGVSAVFEASASGKAVIATNTGGMDEYIKDGETGILVPPHDPVALQEAIRKLWENPDLANQMGAAGRKYLEREFNYEIINSRATSFLLNTWKANSTGEPKI